MSDKKEAMFYEKAENNKVSCRLCPHYCFLENNATGICGARKNENGKLYSMNYGILTSLVLDPIEKKPFRHFHPGKKILSAGSFGCNLKCSFCQNWQISQTVTNRSEAPYQTAASVFTKNSARTDSLQLVNLALKTVPEGNIGIAFTYNEPSIWYEFVYDTVKTNRDIEAKLYTATSADTNDKNIKLRNIYEGKKLYTAASADTLYQPEDAFVEGTKLYTALVTNGYIEKEPLDLLLPYIDAMNIDLKSFTPSFYQKICRGRIEPVKETIMAAAKVCHVEITTLVIPGENDCIDEINRLAEWLSCISPEITLHLTRFHPDFKMTDKAATPVSTLNAAATTAGKYLKNVYIGNV